MILLAWFIDFVLIIDKEVFRENQSNFWTISIFLLFTVFLYNTSEFVCPEKKRGSSSQCYYSRSIKYQSKLYWFTKICLFFQNTTVYGKMNDMS